MFDFDALGARIFCVTTFQLPENFKIFEFSTDGPSVDHQWPPVEKPPYKPIFLHRWRSVVH